MNEKGKGMGDNLIQMTIVYIAVGMYPLEEME